MRARSRRLDELTHRAALLSELNATLTVENVGIRERHAALEAANAASKADLDAKVGELERALTQRDQEVSELRTSLDVAEEDVRKQRQNVRDAEASFEQERSWCRAAEGYRRMMVSSEFVVRQLKRDFFCVGDVYLLVESLTALAQECLRRGVADARATITNGGRLPYLIVSRPEGTRWICPAPVTSSRAAQGPGRGHGAPRSGASESNAGRADTRGSSRRVSSLERQNQS